VKRNGSTIWKGYHEISFFQDIKRASRESRLYQHLTLPCMDGLCHAGQKFQFCRIQIGQDFVLFELVNGDHNIS
jgi:hypothetical protein